ncbi:hypothetical protein MFLO_14402 [Listeria floridensis FSL S10-1187]|uniref:DUF4870 domain-containing protein n=1 Tax=Listeria floridensis FSL S10-1187 TaxID=1265817 RepID=A0ABN0RC53_9LIST|nr:hypothetical protein MFLO_14402 [Listeria floridensis FSL S10-1187]
MFSPFELQGNSFGPALFFSVMIIILTFGAVLLFKQQKIERNGQLFAFKWVKWPLCLLFSLSVGAVTANSVDGNLDPGISLAAYFTVAILTAFILFFVCIFIVKRFSAYFQMTK